MVFEGERMVDKGSGLPGLAQYEGYAQLTVGMNMINHLTTSSLSLF